MLHRSYVSRVLPYYILYTLVYLGLVRIYVHFMNAITSDLIENITPVRPAPTPNIIIAISTTISHRVKLSHRSFK